MESVPGPIIVTDVPRPKIEEPEDAIVRITTSTICGSDLHLKHGLYGSFDEQTGVGHEAVGIVEEVGKAVDFLKPGDRVVVISFHEDGRLLPKQTLVPVLEDEGRQAVGLSSLAGQPHGLQAQYIRVLWADSSLVKIPNTLPDKEWLPLADVWPTGWSGLDWSGFEPGDTVAVFGAGPIGLMATYSAIIRGASLVYVIDHVPARLAKAAGLGAVPINFTRGGKASDQILRLRPNGVKRAVDAVGMTALNDELEPQEDYVIQEALVVTRGLGGIGIAGSYPAERPIDPAPGYENITGIIKLPIGVLHFKELRLQSGIVRYFDVIPKLVELIRNGRARPGFIFTDEMSLEDAPRAYERFERREEVKILLNTGTREGRNGTVTSRLAT